MTKYYLIIILIFISTKIFSQYRQIDNIPIFYNSAFCGTSNCSNIYISNNIHPITKTLNFYSNSLLFDIKLKKIKSGILFSINKITSPNNILNKLEISFAYSYNFKISKKIRLSTSVKTNYYKEYFNNISLIYPNMISVYSNELTPNTENIPDYKINNLLIDLGILFYSKDFIVGLSIKNINSISFSKKYNYEKKYIFLGEKKIKYSKNTLIYIGTSNILSRNENLFSIGTKLQTNNIIFGGYFLENIFENKFNTGMLIQLGLFWKSYQINYSYNFYFNNKMHNKNSVHELIIRFKIKCTEKNINNTIICPAY